MSPGFDPGKRKLRELEAGILESQWTAMTMSRGDIISNLCNSSDAVDITTS